MLPARAPSISPDAELAASYVVTHVASRAGHRLRQGERKPPLSPRTRGPFLNLLATTRLLGISHPIAQALSAWGDGERHVHLLLRVPTPFEVLAWQAKGERCVSLLPDGVPTAPHEDGLAFALHDLCHLEKFAAPVDHPGQVGFFSAVHDAVGQDGWKGFVDRFDDVFVSELEHVVADMNGSAVFLFAALKMKLKMGARRRVARALGRAPRVTGPLDPEEIAAYGEELETLFDFLRLHGVVRDAARRVSTRRDDHDAAEIVLTHFESLGSTRLSPR